MMICAVLVLVATAAYPAPLAVSLAVDPPVTTVGLPPTLRFTVTNKASVPAKLPRNFIVIATPDGGEPFAGRSLEGTPASVSVQFDWIEPLYELEDPMGEERFINVPARGSLVVEVPVKPGFYEPSMYHRNVAEGLEPGRYRLRLFFTQTWEHYHDPAILRVGPENVPKGAVLSSEASLTVRDLQGADAAACAYAREVTEAKEVTCGVGLLPMRGAAAFDEFLEKHGRSSVARAVAHLRPARDQWDRIAQLERAARETLPAYADWHRLRLAEEERLAYFAVRKDDILRARRYLHQARARYAELAKQSKVVEVRRIAQRELAGIVEFINPHS